jgi:hypothetical protein
VVMYPQYMLLGLQLRVAGLSYQTTQSDKLCYLIRDCEGLLLESPFSN